MADAIKLMMGLGNPGPDYENTRHNAGRCLVEALIKRNGLTLRQETKFQASITTCHVNGHKVILAIPTTYMNHSGFPTQLLMKFFKIDPSALLVAHDDLDLPTGTIRFKSGGGHGGNNGLRHIIAQLGNQRQFHRLRIGIGHPGDKSKVTNHVLSVPTRSESTLLEAAIDEGLKHLDAILKGDFQNAMNSLHRFQAAQPDTLNGS